MKLKELLNCIEFDTRILIINYYDSMSFKHDCIFFDCYNEGEEPKELKEYYEHKVINISLNSSRRAIVIDIKEEIKC